MNKLIEIILYLFYIIINILSFTILLHNSINSLNALEGKKSLLDLSSTFNAFILQHEHNQLC